MIIYQTIKYITIFLQPFLDFKQLRIINKKTEMLPMQKIITPLNKTDLIQQKKNAENQQQMQPKQATLNKILQFAATYRAEKIAENQFVELFLN